MPERSRVMTQTKRDNLVLQVGGLAWGLQPHTVKKLIVTKVEKRKSWMDLTMMERVGDRWEKMEGSCSTGQSPQWAVVPVEEEEASFLAGRAKDLSAPPRIYVFRALIV
jgi:hypothetical protein